jgi:imidazolonepropionase-like amidohydrolase
MKYLFFSLPVITMLILSSCGQQEAADLVILNAKVLTIDTDNPSAEAIAVKDDKITAVGTTGRIRKMIDPEKTQVIDASGRLVIPGFNDAHVHFGPLDPDFIELRYTTDRL